MTPHPAFSSSTAAALAQVPTAPMKACGTDVAPQQIARQSVSQSRHSHISPTQREAAIRRGLALANSLETRARNARALVAQLKEIA